MIHTDYWLWHSLINILRKQQNYPSKHNPPLYFSLVTVLGMLFFLIFYRVSAFNMLQKTLHQINGDCTKKVENTHILTTNYDTLLLPKESSHILDTFICYIKKQSIIVVYLRNVIFIFTNYLIWLFH